MNTSVESTVLWLLLTIASMILIFIAVEVRGATKRWYLDRLMDHAVGFFAATFIVCGILTLLSL